MLNKSPKHALFELFARVARAIGHAARLELIEQLAQGERRVELLAERTGLSVANASQHLQQLRRAGLVTSHRDGKFVVYRLADESVLELLGTVRGIAERQLAEVERIVRSYFADRDSLEPVSREELLERSREGLVTILDVRPAEEFALGHLPGAVNVPLRQLEDRLREGSAPLAEVDPSREIVAYCRGPYCVLSYEAVALLRSRGFTARRLVDGLPEWRAAGFPIDVT
ncbi:MAG: metalloregulator ArsR/SmtB family transcription factor [Luteitalea sp.]|nr:metalloregulator ArsR/SmtB family transcription factor [Luteitalea sp.]